MIHRITLLFLLFFAAAHADYVEDLVAKATVYTVEPTGSMKPTFDENWLLLVIKVPWKSLKVGDIIVFRKHGHPNPIVHRIMVRSSEGTLAITRGDNNSRPDPSYVSEDQYVGLVVGIVRRFSLDSPPQVP